MTWIKGFIILLFSVFLAIDLWGLIVRREKDRIACIVVECAVISFVYSLG